MATRNWIILLALFVGGALVARDTPSALDRVEINNVVWYYKPEKTFKRILEYIDGEERTGRKIILRTQPEPRAGLYFIVRISEYIDELPPGCAFAVDLIRPDIREAQTTRFELPAKRTPHREIWLGFTGESEPPDESAPVAWQIRLLGPDGTTVARRHSFLWKMPDPEDEAGG